MSFLSEKNISIILFFNQEIEDKTLTKMYQVVQFLFLKPNVYIKP